MDRRDQIANMLGKLASDPTAHPDTRQNAFQMALETLHAAPGKVVKPDINRLITTGPKQPTQTATTPSAQAGPPHDLTNLIPQGQPMPTPPTSAGQPMPQLRQLTGQIGARREALQGMELPPQEKAMMTLGMPITGLVGAYGAGDVMPVSAAAAQGLPLPQGIDSNGWVRIQRNKLGQAIGSYPTNQPAAYAPTETKGFTYQPDAQGNIVAIPTTTVRQKEMPTPPGGTPAKPTASIDTSKRKTVGHVKPPQTLMIVPPTKSGDQPHAIAASPGSTIPPGAVTASGFSSVSVPTSSTRTRAEFAQGLLQHIDPTIALVKHMDKEGKLGPLASRWNEFMAGRVGAGDPEFDALRDDIGMLQSGMMVPHVGARGGTTLIAKFKGMVDSGKMDAIGLTTGLGEWKKFLTTYAKEGQLKGWGNEPVAVPDTSWHSQFGGAVR